MTRLTMVSWKKGLQTVSLMDAVREHSGASLSQAKAAVERLLAGEPVSLDFPSQAACEKFRMKAESCGVIFE